MSTLPDIDLKIPFIKHRGPTHTLWFAVLLGAIIGGAAAFALGDWMSGVILGAAATYGIIGHLVGDVLTPMGVRPLNPFSDASYSLDLVRASNSWANKGLVAIGGVALVLALQIGFNGGENTFEMLMGLVKCFGVKPRGFLFPRRTLQIPRGNPQGVSSPQAWIWSLPLLLGGDGEASDRPCVWT